MLIQHLIAQGTEQAWTYLPIKAAGPQAG